MAHIHTHTLPDGTPTSVTVVDPDNDDLHWHTVDGGITSTDDFAAGHTHTFEGLTTSGPINQASMDNMNENEETTVTVTDIKESKMENKFVGGNILEVKQEERNGEPVGIVKGYIATFDLDRGDDMFLKGAFVESLARHRLTDRPIRLKDQHGRTVGGFPIQMVMEDERGLLGTGEINLNVQQGAELFALVKQGVLTDMSIGFSSLKDFVENGIRFISKAEIWEGSIVDEPMNTAANIIMVKEKAAVPFQDLPMGSRDTSWDSDAAVARVREFTNSTDEPSADYKNAFLWYDAANAKDFGAYKLPIADVKSGRLTAMPRAIFAAAGALSGARGGVDIPQSDEATVITNVERYYSKMDLDSPFDKRFFMDEDLAETTARILENALVKGVKFSRKAAKNIVSVSKTIIRQEEITVDIENDSSQDDWKSVLSQLKNMQETLNAR